MRAIYCRSHTLGGFAIRAAQGFAQWSHGGVVMPGNRVIHARAFKGVTSEPLDEFCDRYSHWEIVDIYTPDPAGAYALAQMAEDQAWPYGYGEVFNFITHKLGRFDESGRVQCIELLELAALHGGRVGDLRRFRPHVPLHAITPHQSYITR